MIENNFLIVLRFYMINKLNSTLYVSKGGKVNNPIKKNIISIETHQQDNKRISPQSLIGGAAKSGVRCMFQVSINLDYDTFIRLKALEN